MNPWLAQSPRNRLAAGTLKVLHTDPAEGWSLAEMIWDDERRVGLRWDGDLKNQADRGNPTSHGNGTWFILPDSIADRLLTGLDLSPSALPDDGVGDYQT